MGRIPVVVRLVRPDGEEWWPATANRWTHVLVHWVEDGQAQDRRYELAWLRAEDVRRFLRLDATDVKRRWSGLRPIAAAISPIVTIASLIRFPRG